MTSGSTQIHPTALVETGAQIGNGVRIGPFCVISGASVLSDNVSLGPGCVLENRVELGEGTRLIGHSTLGTPGEMGHKGDRLVAGGRVVIEANVTIREYVTINAPVRTEETRVGQSCYLMSRTYVPHDAQLEALVTMATNSVIGGGVHVGKGAYIGFGSVTHQWLHIGTCAMIGMGAAVTKNIPPYFKVAGCPAKMIGLNIEGARRLGVSEGNLQHLSDLGHQAYLGGSHEMPSPELKTLATFCDAKRAKLAEWRIGENL